MRAEKTPRGRVLAGTTALGGFSVLRSGYGAVSNTLRVGVVGCGGRGRGAIRDVLILDANVEVVALADIRQDMIDLTMESFKNMKEGGKVIKGFHVTPDRCFVGVDAYKQVIDSDVDIVFLATPPGWRPMQFEYAVNAGKHTFCEKPVAVDPAGIRKFLAAADKARAKGLGVLAGTHRRHERGHQEAIRRLWNGDIGDVISARVYRVGGSIWYRDREPGMSELDYWLHNWYHVDFLSGDHIVEQAVHFIDIGNWIMNDTHPVKAYGMGGRQYHTDRGGNIYDHFTVEYEYPNGRRIVALSRQIDRTDGRLGADVAGSHGTAYFSNDDCHINGIRSWQSPKGATSAKAYEYEHQDFVESLRSGKPLNEAQRIADSTMTAILGREAAYTGKVVTWDELYNSNMNLWPEDLMTWDGRLRPVPKPGMKRV